MMLRNFLYQFSSEKNSVTVNINAEIVPIFFFQFCPKIEFKIKS